MELDFDNDEFESFLKQKADQYKMYPSEKTWKGISFVLHSRNRLITIGGSLLLISVFFFFGGRFLNSQRVASDKPAQENKIITKFSSVQGSNFLPVSPENARKSVLAATSIALNNKVLEAPLTTAMRLKKSSQSVLSPEASPIGATEILPTAENTVADESSLLASEKESAAAPSSSTALTPNVNGSDKLTTSSVSGETSMIQSEEAFEKSVNWLQEIAAIKLSSPRQNPFNFRFYFSPMVSYRRLADNGFKGFNSSGSLFNSGYSHVDRMVDHKPAIGVELGSNVLYSVGRSLILKSGVQLNYSRYTIKAYKSYVEKASIALNSVGQGTSDTITSYTNVRNFNGYSAEILENQYLQVSVPVGAELVLLGKKKLQFSIAGTVQPTYLIFNDAYLLTTDYVHYTKEPSLVRKWNVHTSAEAFISYKSGGLRWQVGPQFRYQLMSSYTDRYPIKEYLMEYGIKFGISKTLK